MSLFKPDLEMVIGLLLGVYVIPFILAKLQAMK